MVSSVDSDGGQPEQGALATPGGPQVRKRCHQPCPSPPSTLKQGVASRVSPGHLQIQRGSLGARRPPPSGGESDPVDWEWRSSNGRVCDDQLVKRRFLGTLAQRAIGSPGVQDLRFVRRPPRPDLACSPPPASSAGSPVSCVPAERRPSGEANKTMDCPVGAAAGGAPTGRPRRHVSRSLTAVGASRLG